MISTFINAWKVADLRKKMLFTALIVLIFRIGAAIPVPFTNISGDNGIIDPTGETFMNYLSMMTGEAFAYGTIFALSITPYINSSIIIQLLGIIVSVHNQFLITFALFCRPCGIMGFSV